MPPLVAQEWRDARNDLADLEATPDELAAAAAYVARWPHHPPDYFADRRRELARQAFGNGEGWACRLLSAVDSLAHFTLHTEHIGLDRGAAAPALLFDRENVRRWRAAILSAFVGPCRWRLELGSGGRIHAHVLADAAELPELPRGGRIVSPCESYLEAAVGYVLKPPLAYIAEHLALWLKARKRGRLPTLAGSRGVPQRRAWANRSELRIHFASAPAATSPTPAPQPQPRRRSGSLGRPRGISAAVASRPLAPSREHARRREPTTSPFSPSCRHRRARGPPRPRLALDLSPSR